MVRRDFRPRNSRVASSPSVVGMVDSDRSQTSDVAVSHYNGLAASVQHRFNRGLQMQANYLYGHALDEVSNGGLKCLVEFYEF